MITTTTFARRLVTAAMLACFALAGWFWTHESSSRPQQATAATVSRTATHATTTTRVTASTPARAETNRQPTTPELQPRYVTKNIEDVRLGQRLVGRNPLRHESSSPSEITPETWRAVRMTMLQGGAFYDLAFLRSVEWLDEARAKVGQHIELVMPEMGLLGPALVQSIEPCPDIESDDGSGRMIVTGTMSHLATNVLELTITGLDEPLGVTTTHPIWSEDRQAFLPAGQLREGEHLRTVNGQNVQLTRITPKRGPPELVYNLEVDAENVYHVADTGLLVHNTCVSWTSSRPDAIGDHIFSKDHVRSGVNALGDSQAVIKQKVGDIIGEVNQKNLLKAGDNQIKTLINGVPVTIRANFLPDGTMRSANLFTGDSGRILGNLIEW